MSDGIYAGIDCGDRQLTTVYVEDAQALSLPVPQQVVEPKVFFDRSANISRIGVGFPSIVQSVGTRRTFFIDQTESTAEAVMEHRLAVIRQGLLSQTATPPGKTVLAVPRSLNQTRRQVLLGCATAAGFDDVSLIDKCTAGALGYHVARAEPKTILVLHLAYADCEYAIASVAEGHCQVVACRQVPEICGEILDALIIEGVILALRQKRIFLGLRQLLAEHWLAIQQLAEKACQQLTAHSGATASLPAQFTGLEQTYKVRLRASGYAAKVLPLVRRMVESIQATLAEHDLQSTDIDEFLLVGEASRSIPDWSPLRDSFDGNLRLADPRLVATGAAWEACQAADTTLQLTAPTDLTLERLDISSPNRSPSDDAQTDDVELAEVIDPLQGVEGPTPDATQTSQLQPLETNLAEVRELIDKGRYDDAEAALRAVTHAGETLKRELEALQPLRMLQRAQAMLSAGEYSRAVNKSHEAYEAAPDDPVIFEGMKKLHEDAGRGLDRPEEYASALNILKCAQQHDPTDRSIRKATANRHCQHAVAMKSQNNLSEALDAVNAALVVAPKHPEANQLLEELLANRERDGEPGKNPADVD